MNRSDFIKLGAPVWIHVPGTPFTMPGERTQYERLPGMEGWAARDVVQRVNKDLKKGTPIKDIEEEEAGRELGTHVGTGALGGATLGLLGGRLAGGETATAPLKNIITSGLNRKSLQGLSKMPRIMKALPALGLGGGLAAGLGSWAASRDSRRHQARDVSKGLLSERILQQKSLQDAAQSVDKSNTVLSGMPLETARQETPLIATQGNSGV